MKPRARGLRSWRSFCVRLLELLGSWRWFRLPGRLSLLRNGCVTHCDCADCLAVTLEMPFKDPILNLQPATGWNGARSAQLGEATVDVIADTVHSLR